jgi:hypothetical protein
LDFLRLFLFQGFQPTASFLQFSLSCWEALPPCTTLRAWAPLRELVAFLEGIPSLALFSRHFVVEYPGILHLLPHAIFFPFKINYFSLGLLR